MRRVEEVSQLMTKVAEVRRGPRDVRNAAGRGVPQDKAIDGHLSQSSEFPHCLYLQSSSPPPRALYLFTVTAQLSHNR